MTDTFCNLTLQEELATLIALRIACDLRARSPRTDPRDALRDEQNRAATDLKIADLQAKAEDAKIIHFPSKRRRRS